MYKAPPEGSYSPGKRFKDHTATSILRDITKETSSEQEDTAFSEITSAAQERHKDLVWSRLVQCTDKLLESVDLISSNQLSPLSPDELKQLLSQVLGTAKQKRLCDAVALLYDNLLKVAATSKKSTSSTQKKSALQCEKLISNFIDTVAEIKAENKYNF